MNSERASFTPRSHLFLSCPSLSFQVIVVEDDNGNVVRETMKDNDVLQQYKTMRETLVYLCHLDNEDTEAQMLDKLRLQVKQHTVRGEGRDGGWSRQCRVNLRALWFLGGLAPRARWSRLNTISLDTSSGCQWRQVDMAGPQHAVLGHWLHLWQHAGGARKPIPGKCRMLEMWSGGSSSSTQRLWKYLHCHSLFITPHSSQVTVIRDLLNLCEVTRGKDNKAVIASNIM